MSESDEKTVSLVLGSGGARGLAHIGVIRYLEESQYDIRSIAGCSMGAVIGGIYAAGKLAEYEKWVCAIDRVDIVSLLDFSWQKDGLVKGEKIISTLKGLIGEYEIEDLPVRFTAVATDFRAEKEVWIQKGSLFDAMRASMSLPLFFTPFEYKGRRLIDGGVLNPVPIAPTFSDHNDLTIAVNLSGKVDSETQKHETMRIRASDDSDDEDQSILRRKISQFLDSLGDRLARGASQDELDVLEIANLAFDAMQGAISRQKLAAYPPDKVITIPSNVASVLEFDRARELIDIGYQAAEEQLKGN
ncbi:MAG: patatin-like phospholipase family protein [Woeseiaceae bacterium]|nr:patatin-like phospholipase family protein [Woeseiaceae bacterium]